MDNRTDNNNPQFYWWFGVVEDRDDPLRMGRCKVRIIGYHVDDKSILPTEDLPWAMPIMPANSASTGGVGWSPTGAVTGTWVVGFFADGSDGQHPMFFGTVGAVPGGLAGDGCAPMPGSVSDGNGGLGEGGTITPVDSGAPDQVFWTLVAMCACEAGINDAQGQCDVAQAIYNRAALGSAVGYKNGGLLGNMLAARQFESAWRFPTRGLSEAGIPNRYWRNISDANSAAAAAGRGVTPQQMLRVAENLRNPTLQANARSFVGPRTDFLGANQPADNMTRNGSKVQRNSSSNKFGFSYNYRGTRVASVPSNIQSTATA